MCMFFNFGSRYDKKSNLVISLVYKQGIHTTRDSVILTYSSNTNFHFRLFIRRECNSPRDYNLEYLHTFTNVFADTRGWHVS